MFSNYLNSTQIYEDIGLLISIAAVYQVLKNVTLFCFFFIYFVLIKKDSKVAELWSIFKSIPTFREKCLIFFFVLEFAIPNKVLIHNNAAFFVGFCVTSFLAIGAFFHPIFYLFLLENYLLLFESLAFTLCYEKTKMFPNFINSYIFPTAQFRVMLFEFFFG